jgi:glycosidase
MEFHISAAARNKYSFEEVLFAKRGNLLLSNYRAALRLAERLKDHRAQLGEDPNKISAADLYAIGLMDEIFHFVIEKYQKEVNPAAFQKALTFLSNESNAEDIDGTLEKFNEYFPPSDVFSGKTTLQEYLQNAEDGVSNRETSLEEMLLLWVENRNPALETYRELFDESPLREETKYADVHAGLYWFFENSPKFTSVPLNLIDFLMEPARKFPGSIAGQLEFIKENWAEVIGDLIGQILRGLDFIKEEQNHFAFLGAGTVQTFVPDYAQGFAESDVVKFAIDKEWMPKLVLIAKNAYVWLDQLSKEYGRHIHYLNEVPDEELDRLRHMGITGLWLIGLWERSRASADIKRLCGNPEALASAYSLYEYEVASDLGGELAYQNLFDRAIRRGIRLGSDMVPNHMGIDSPWVVEHPDWFVQLSYPPFPGYSFSGPNLSSDDRVEILLEDHYYERSDASVVFKLHEKWHNRDRYIYHGNDGTSMPWNDTAQLNYLLPEVREAVMNQILAVAKKFPVVRFDAAMTLTKKHFQRLWYPEPGSGGDIPSRAEFGLTKAEFDKAMPAEFWQEVVDRVAQEAPDTLLLAEAFWLMEGYFVRTLGMHRVYNSAFMNMLRDEENAKYRDLIRKTLEFEPQILQRYVNFMNNPDEETAVNQFGKGDKYFGVCAMMATLPGLPMFGHGQFEGYSEKYGMEYKKAYWDEQVDEDLFNRHAAQISPLLHRRELFSYVENFRLYNLADSSGNVQEDVFVYSNRLGENKAVFVFHNRYADTSGRIFHSEGYKVKDNDQLYGESVADALQVPNNADCYVSALDQMTGLTYLYSAKEIHEQGLSFHLHAYECRVLVDFALHFVDENHPFDKLHQKMVGNGVGDLMQALHALELEPIHTAFREIAHPAYLSYLSKLDIGEEKPSVLAQIQEEALVKFRNLLAGINAVSGTADASKEKAIVKQVKNAFWAALNVSNFTDDDLPGMKTFVRAREIINKGFVDEPERQLVFYLLPFVQYLGLLVGDEDFESASAALFDKWRLRDIVADCFAQMGIDEPQTQKLINTLQMSIVTQCWYVRSTQMKTQDLFVKLFSIEQVQRFLGFNLFEEVIWFNEEAMQELEWWMITLAFYHALSGGDFTATLVHEAVIGSYEVTQQLREARLQAGYQVEKLIKFLKPEKK